MAKSGDWLLLSGINLSKNRFHQNNLLMSRNSALKGLEVRKRFRLGEFVCTPAAEDALAESGQLPTDFLEQHLYCDWGDVSDELRALNEEGLKSGGRLQSIYKTLYGKVIWIVTEEDRSKTTLLLPEEL